MKKNISIIGIVLGFAIVILGLYTAFGFNEYCGGSYTSSYSFGADFYTEEYNATENAANNVIALGDYLEDVMDFACKAGGIFVALLGGTIACYFWGKLEEAKHPQIPSAPITAKQEIPAQMSDELPEI